MLLGLVLAALVSPQVESVAPLVEPGVLERLRGVTADVAKTGETGLVARMHTTLLGLGDEADGLARLVEKWESTAAGARPTRSTRAAVANRLTRELEPLLRALESAEGERKHALARWILELDSEQPEANAALGHRFVDGRWLTPEEERWHAGAGRVAARVLSAGAQDFEIERESSDNPTLRALGVAGHVVRARGIELHSRMPPQRLERILVRLLRAASLSHGLLKDSAPLPRKLAARKWVLLDTQAHWMPALDEARAGNGITAEQRAQALDLGFGSVLDGRGWRTMRWRSEADFAAAMLYDLLDAWMPHDTQPCLRVGHLQWLCLTALGTSMPLIAWRELDAADAARDARTTARLEDEVLRRARWRSTRRSLWGSRSWMVARVREGRDPPWARAMLDDDGKIRDENLLKTMLVCAMLQEEDGLAALVGATRGGGHPVARFEKALGSLPELEERWKRWMDPERREGVLQRLRGGAGSADRAEGPGKEVEAGLLALNQARANALKGQSPEIRVVALDAELSRAALLHARYLELNPEQKSLWPEVHEEFPGNPGFTVEGSLAGSRSLISFGLGPEAAVRSWLGTFYHRLPLLDPGLFGVGLGEEAGTLVLDARSLVLETFRDHVVVWPLADDVGVPLRFEPEAPNPVPAADMETFGYPVTVQLFFGETRERVELALELFEGDVDGKRVACHAISPDAPLNIELVPENAWALVPERPLAASTRYTARARWGDQERVWSFTTGRR